MRPLCRSSSNGNRSYFTFRCLGSVPGFAYISRTALAPRLSTMFLGATFVSDCPSGFRFERDAVTSTPPGALFDLRPGAPLRLRSPSGIRRIRTCRCITSVLHTTAPRPPHTEHRRGTMARLRSRVASRCRAFRFGLLTCDDPGHIVPPTSIRPRPSAYS